MPYSDLAQQTTHARSQLVEALRLDLVGPDNHPQNLEEMAREILPEPPDLWYLTGFLIPEGTKIEDKSDPTADDDNDADQDPAADNGNTERVGGRQSFLPSSMGLSVLVPPGVDELKVTVEWGDYVRLGASDPLDQAFTMDLDAWAREVKLETVPTYLKMAQGFARVPREEELPLTIPEAGKKSKPVPVGVGRHLWLEIFSRPVQDGVGLTAGTRSVSVFLVNRRAPSAPGRPRYPAYAFQVKLQLECDRGFTPRPNLKGLAGGRKDADERVSDLHYRDVQEFGVGHNVSTRAPVHDGVCRSVTSDWMPQAEVERVEPATDLGFVLGMEDLAALTTATQISQALAPLPSNYEVWIQTQEKIVESLSGEMRSTGADLAARAREAARRIAKGIQVLQTDSQARAAFLVANRAMALAARQRRPNVKPTWRPFQLAFVLLNLPGIADPQDADREVVDLLFFPTGGGKTEAYLGLAAFTLVLRRLKNPEVEVRGTKVPMYAGMTVLMRYTLRLLTLDQLGRAATLICALEAQRREEESQGNLRLGIWPFEIGLWVGSGATPNRLGRRGDDAKDKDYTAYSKWEDFQKKEKEPPVPIQNCPWCQTPFEKSSFKFVPHQDDPTNMVIQCKHLDCMTNLWPYLPIVSIDEPLYRRLPAFVIATVDKFAALPWTGQVGMLFGKVNRFEKDVGFYGAAETSREGVALDQNLLPPELVIQDELHLISGPLGTIAGIYETAIEALYRRTSPDGKVILPKIVASTATVRRAEQQIRALFGRSRSEVFPPQGPNREDSYFAKTMKATDTPARLYLGVCAPGRSSKVASLQVILTLLSRAQALYEEAGGGRKKDNPVDPYMTLLMYFNSLRELGGSRNMIHDQVGIRLETYGNHKRVYPTEGLFSSRVVSMGEIQELTSRVSTDKVALAKEMLALPFGKKDAVDIALATNMISVGLDITRLGLMLVTGQPKAAAEYIQSTSRVGRDQDRPGLVITIFNPYKPRDRSHYERFPSWHASFYRAVEATSVTPFSPRAIDRALAGALVGMVRHGHPGMAPGEAAHTVVAFREDLKAWAQLFADRAATHDESLDPQEAEALKSAVLSQANHLLDTWAKLADQDYKSKNAVLHYTKKDGPGKQATNLLSEALAEEFEAPASLRRQFRANRSMRDVQAPVVIFTGEIEE